jgi:5-methylcytosine-specific restriction endonuclease McrA
MLIPESENLPVNRLAACFNNTVATYKFYWFISILQEVENGASTIPKINLFSRMISNAWYTVNYFHVSFGKQDLIQQAVSRLKYLEEIPIDQDRSAVLKRLKSSTIAETQRVLRHFNANVPHWFLSPWFTGEKNKNKIYDSSKSFENGCLYALYNDHIKINPSWNNYLQKNVRVLKDFCYWNLTLFLQVRNPSVPDIANKLIRPATRASLTKQRTHFWDLVFKELGTLNCIYTNKELAIGNYAVEHFVPYQFVSHDLIWNLIPADSSFNSTKSDKLPSLEKYFTSFYNIQIEAINIVQKNDPKNKLLEDYLTIFPNWNGITLQNFKDRIEPLISIASNNGFEFLS